MSLLVAAMLLASVPAERKAPDSAFEDGRYVLALEFVKNGAVIETTLDVLVTVEKNMVRISVERGQDLVVGVLANNKFQSVPNAKATIVLSGELIDDGLIVGSSRSTIGKANSEGTFTLTKSRARSSVR